MLLTNEEIIAYATEFAACPLAEIPKMQYFCKKYPEFRKDYPALFVMCCEPGGIDTEKLTFMLNMRKNIGSNQMTVDKASEVIGQKFFNEYVQPKVNSMVKKE